MVFSRRSAAQKAGLIYSFLLLLSLVVCLCSGCSRNDIIYGNLSAEDLAITLLGDNREDVDAAISALRQQRENSPATNLHTKFDYTQSYSADYVSEALGDTLYRRLMLHFCNITFYKDGTIAFSSDGFLRGYSGFYYSTTGKKNIGGDADWYETHPLEENFYFFNFGY